MENVAIEVEIKGKNVNVMKEIDPFYVLGIEKGWTSNLANIVDKCANKENVILKRCVKCQFHKSDEELWVCWKW